MDALTLLVYLNSLFLVGLIAMTGHQMFQLRALHDSLTMQSKRPVLGAWKKPNKPQNKLRAITPSDPEFVGGARDE